jgi:hypothetical protein
MVDELEDSPGYIAANENARLEELGLMSVGFAFVL